MPAASEIKVMIVDDQTHMRSMIRHSLEEIGFRQVRDEPDAAQALEAVRSDRVQLIISDYNMPEMDGLAFLQAVRGDPQIGKTVFIMLTGSPEPELIERASALGADHFMAKPFLPAALKDKIELAFGRLS